MKLAVPQDVLGYTSEAHWLRFAGDHLRYLCPYLPPATGPGLHQAAAPAGGHVGLADRA